MTAERQSAQTRELVFDIASRAADEGIPVVVSSDEVVEVADGPEVLVHADDAIDMARAPLPIIATHQGGQINVGIVDGLRVAGGEMRGIARFGKRQEAREYEADVMGGIIRSVSVGYRRIRAKFRNDGVLVTSRWMPTHVAMVAEPADARAGFYRADAALQPLVIEPADATPSTDSERALRADPPAAPAAVNEGVHMDTSNSAAAGVVADTAVRNDGTSVERLRIKDLTNLAKRHKIDDKQLDAWIDGGSTVDEASRAVLDIMAERTTRNPETVAKLDLSPKDLQRYSLFKAVRAALDKDWKNAGFELECSRTVAQRLNKIPDANTFYIPFDVQQRAVPVQRQDLPFHMQRDLTVASASGGGYLVDTQNLGFIDLLRNRSVAFRMGVRRLSGLNGNVTVPKQSGGATPYWLGTEATAVTEGDQTFTQISLTPHTVGAYTEVSRLLTLQSSPDAEGIVTSDLAKVVSIAADLAVLNGSGAAGQPLGIINTPSIGSTTATTVDYSKVLAFQTDVAAANVMPMSGGYVTTSTVAGILAAKSRFANTDTPLWDGNIWDARMAGFPAMSSEQMPSGTMLFGDWSEVVVAEWGVLEIAVNPTANFQAGIIGIRALYSMDVGVRYAGAFSYSSSVTA